jgi:hypothetical protein
VGHGVRVCGEAALPTRVFPLAARRPAGVLNKSSRRPILPRSFHATGCHTRAAADGGGVMHGWQLSGGTFRFRAVPARSPEAVGGRRLPARRTALLCKARAAAGPKQPRERLAGALLLGSPLGRREAVCRALSAARTSLGWAGDNDCGVAAPFSVLGWLSSGPTQSTSSRQSAHGEQAATLRRALEHSADYAGRSPDSAVCGAAHNFSALCLGARPKPPSRGMGGLQHRGRRSSVHRRTNITPRSRPALLPAPQHPTRRVAPRRPRPRTAPPPCQERSRAPIAAFRDAWRCGSP